MTPAIECNGCGATWKTVHEPAAPGEMDKLFYATAVHKADVATNMTQNVMNFLSVLKGEPSKEEKEIHKVTFTYHETTPSTGFEDAEVV